MYYHVDSMFAVVVDEVTNKSDQSFIGDRFHNTFLKLLNEQFNE